jgi:hypothetical protein
MANFELVSAYKKEDAAWLREHGYPRPKARRGNKLPSTTDMKWALDGEVSLVFDYPDSDEELYGQVGSGSRFVIRGFDWNDDRPPPADHFVVRGAELILPVLIKLCERCGQLYVYPDSGAPSIILDSSLDGTAVSELYAEANEQADPWAFFFTQMYGRGGLAAGT